MNDQQELKQNYNAAILYIGSILNDMNYSFEFWNSNTAAFCKEKRTFYFPHLPLEVSQKALDYIWGFVYHELGHALFTDFSALIKATKIGGLTECVYRILEDVWQECRYNAQTPYSFRRLLNLTKVLAEDNLLGSTPEDQPPTVLVRNFLLNYGYSEIVGHSFVDKFAEDDELLMVKTFNLALVTRIKALLFTIHNCENSNDVFALSQMIVVAFEDEQNNGDKNEQPSDDSQSSQSGNDSQGSQSGDDSQSSQSGDDSQSSQSGDDSQSSQSGDDSQGSQSGDDSQINQASGEDSMSKGDKVKMLNALNDVLDATSSQFGDSDRSDLLQNALSESIKESGEPLIYDIPLKPTVFGSDRDFLSLGESVAGGLIPRFKRIFEAKNKSKKSRHKTGNKLIRNSTVKMRVGDPNLFLKKTVVKAVNTHISLVLDNSASMTTGNRLKVSHQAVSAIGLAAERTKGIGLSVCAFPGETNSDSVDVVCTERERFSSVSNRFLDIRGGGCSTPMANGIIWAMEQCLRSKNPRKIIIVITDGKPNGDHKQFVLDMVEKCRLNGVEIWGVGIQEKSVERYFNDSMVINNIEELPQALLDKLIHVI